MYVTFCTVACLYMTVVKCELHGCSESEGFAQLSTSYDYVQLSAVSISKVVTGFISNIATTLPFDFSYDIFSGRSLLLWKGLPGSLCGATGD